jgi:Putative peptidoglycan binding domain
MTTTTPTPDTNRTDTRDLSRIPAGADGGSTRSGNHGPDRSGRRSRRTAVAASALGVLTLAGAATGIALATAGSPSSAPAPVTATATTSEAAVPAPSWIVVSPAQPATPAHAATAGSATIPSGGGHVVPPAPPAPPAPSAAMETLQRELGQLNYYEGPVTGVLNSQTTAAITYLQRDAHLPQTGTMNAATQQALANFLAHGNNQMAG